MRFQIEFTFHPKVCTWHKANQLIMNILELIGVDNLKFIRLPD